MSRETPQDRIWRYAERFFQRSGRTTFPTVAQVARALRMTQARVWKACESCGDGYIFLSCFNVEGGQTRGEHFVETFKREGVPSPT